MTEHDEQSAFMQYVKLRAQQVPGLEWLHAIPNGGARNVVVARKMKAEGVQKGVWDICWPMPRGEWPGLYIEFKFGKNKLTPEQKAFGEFVASQGYKTGVAYSVDEGINILESYIKGE
jgi:hypothetical protein